jgi:hypothetical protein
MLIPQRVCAEIDGPFVLFLIGIRINKPWKPQTWLPVFSAMPHMLAELERRPELGLLHARTHFGLRNAMMVQYWRSHALLQAYAHDRTQAHLPAWAAFNRRVGTSGDVGIWHETYVIEPGQAESIYVGMPPYGLGRAGALKPATGARVAAKERLAAARSASTDDI